MLQQFNSLHIFKMFICASKGSWKEIRYEIDSIYFHYVWLSSYSFFKHFNHLLLSAHPCYFGFLRNRVTSTTFGFLLIPVTSTASRVHHTPVTSTISGLIRIHVISIIRVFLPTLGFV